MTSQTRLKYHAARAWQKELPLEHRIFLIALITKRKLNGAERSNDRLTYPNFNESTMRLESRLHLPEQSQHKQLTLLCIGSLPPPLGGVTVLFQQLCRDLSDRRDVICRVQSLPLGPKTALNRITRMTQTIAGSIWKLPGTDMITLHVPTALVPWLGLVMLMISRLTRKGLVIRKFAGTDYNALDRISARLARFVVRHADLYLAESKALVAIAKRDNARLVEWFPNNRPLDRSNVPVVHNRSCCRFIFVGHVKPTKGVVELIEAARMLPECCSVDIYGPFHDGLTESVFHDQPRVRYCGIVQPEEVVATMERYDALVLPTYHDGEGYPGVIHEAYLAGRPVIVSRWGCLSELVDETSGIFVEPRNSLSLAEAMIRLNMSTELFRSLQEGAQAKARFFDSRAWAERFVEFCLAARYARDQGGDRPRQ